MALLKDKISNIPPEAIILTREDALKHQSDVLKKWKHLGDVWPIRFGGTILASLGALSGIYVNNHYRTRFKLLNYGRMSSYLPTCVIPAVMCLAFHTELVLPGVVLQDECPSCTELRAASIQATVGVVLPTVLASMSSFSLAVRCGTYNIPYITQEPMKAFNLWKMKTLPIKNVLFAIFLGQALAGSVVTYLEVKSIEKVNDRLTLLGYELENDI
ncbi:hypothetical protein FQR65_LT08579 [Abscondita terminalis]|nr:hypothetical protein FQR65_LT08579 [Abscondita terminalis]